MASLEISEYKNVYMCFLKNILIISTSADNIVLIRFTTLKTDINHNENIKSNNVYINRVIVYFAAEKRVNFKNRLDTKIIMLKMTTVGREDSPLISIKSFLSFYMAMTNFIIRNWAS